ncbi:RHS repeat-associated core domain-containing protein [Saccharothrix obliqua]|uniref:RHS repeat-associated core domain-containing protein n=1 Tax=Saccharothrix obliqua TaxID=2861747 RepID=UPI001C5F0866|nr:RHS repeat-associated core domain-containing protein [Saccharothrix obliqua]MBW4718826.1 RHS repeat protein [Saccharothrix obliqua]
MRGKGFLPRAFGVALLVASVMSGGFGTAAADPPATPPTWAPPREVNRDPVGGPPPARARTSADGAHRSAVEPLASTCASDYLGILPWYAMDRRPVSDRFEVLVNLYQRNVVLAYRELTIPGTGLDLSVERFYNSENSDGSWLLNHGAIGLSHYSSGTVLQGPNGYCVFFTLNADGTYAAPQGLHAKLARTSGGYVVSFDATGERWLFTGSGWLVSRTDRNGNTITNRYHADGTPASVTDTQGRVTTFAHDDRGRPKSITDPAGQTYGDYAYDSRDNLSEFTDRAGGKVRITYTSSFPYQPTTITDSRGGVYRFEYDDRNRLSKLTTPTPDGAGATTTYSSTANTTTVTDANGHTSRHEFDSARLLRTTDALGHTRSQTWTAAGDLSTTTNALQHTTTHSHDSLANPTGTRLPTGARTTTGYTNPAHPHLPTQFTDGSGNRTSREYDLDGNLTKVRSTDLNADIRTYTYNRLGLVESRTDGKGAKTSYAYDGAGNRIRTTPPAPAKPTGYTYDSLSRVTSVTDGNGVRIDYGYDKLDRVVSITHGATVLQANTYDSNGNLTGTQVPGATRTLEYDPGNRLTKVTRDTEIVSYTYDNVGNLRTLTTPAGTATYTYDAADRLTSLADGGTTTFGYDNADRRTTTNFPGGAVQNTGYDNSGRRISTTAAKAGVELLKATYRYTRPDGGDTDRVQSQTAKGVTTAYTYDGLGRLTKAGNRAYTLDNADNVLTGDGNTYTVNAADQYTAVNGMTVAFDGAGNLTSTANPGSGMTYSPTNQLLTGTAGGVEVLSLRYDTADQGEPRTITETPGGAAPVTHVLTRTALGVSEIADNGQRSLYTRDTEGTLVGLKDAAGNRYGVVTDHQGSVLALVDTAGNLAAEYTYAPYGAVTATGSAAAANPFRYRGAYQLRQGQYLLDHRVYEAGIGRFFAPDPSARDGNAYGYAQADPINTDDRVA